MRLIDINEALQAVDNRIKELNTHEAFRKKADIIDVLGVKKWINNISPIEAIPKADYEARLKADMVAVLEEMKKEMNPIKECEHQIYGKEHWNFAGKCQDVIQQKINELKAESEG